MGRGEITRGFLILLITAIIICNMASNWDKKIKEFSSIKDEWGGIDKKIINLVVALNLSGVKTSISCAGHRGKGSPSPYVTFRGSLKTVEKLLSEFYKNHKPLGEAKIKIFKGKASFWMYSGKEFPIWKRKVDKLAEKLKGGGSIQLAHTTKEERNAMVVNLPLYQKEMSVFAAFLKKKVGE